MEHMVQIEEQNPQIIYSPRKDSQIIQLEATQITSIATLMIF